MIRRPPRDAARRGRGLLHGGGVPPAVPAPTGAPAPETPPTEGAIPVAPSLLVYGAMAILAVVGWSRGVRRELLALALVALAYWLLNQRWAMFEPRLAPLAARGLPTEAVQLAAFLAAVVVAYLLSGRLVRPPKSAGMDLLRDVASLLERVMGAVVGAATGYLVGSFTRARLATAPVAPAITPPPAADLLLQQHAVLLFWLVVGVVILFGVLNLAPKRQQRSG
jgi:uncharacterized membrane protein required for colicin V production